MSQSMQNKYFSDVLVKRDTKTVQSDKVCKECLDHIAAFSFCLVLGGFFFFVTEIQNALIFHSLIEKRKGRF